jgi:AraC family transcriptional regulator
VPDSFATLRVPSHRYAVFRQDEHISTIRRTFSAIWSQWLPASGHKPADAPTLERYGPEFNTTDGSGGFEIWLPIEGNFVSRFRSSPELAAGPGANFEIEGP